MIHSETDHNRDFGLQWKWKQSVMVNGESPINWSELHRWCREQIGSENYTWFGHRFYFMNDQDAVLFALRWV